MFITKAFRILILILILYSCGEKKVNNEIIELSKEHRYILDKIKAYAEVEFEYNLSNLSENQKLMLEKLLKAGEIIDQIFWYQSSHDAIKVRDSLSKLDNPESKDFLRYVMINYGPYDPLNDNKRFVGIGAEYRPKTGGFYPEDMSKEEFENFVKNNPKLKKDFESQYTVIVRENNQLKAIPYHQYYKEIKEVSKLLSDAADLCDNDSFKNYLKLRSKALLNDEYFESDLAWMDVDYDFDLVIGPIENYQDELFNYKSAYEVMLLVKDKEASNELQMYKNNMQNFENSLPIEDKYKQTNIGEGNKIQVVNVIYFGGDCQQAIKTIAAALPNDPKVAEAKGRKLSMFKNHMEAKFDKIVKPIGELLLDEKYINYIDRKAFTSFVTLHEVSHALGPKYKYGTKIDVRNFLKDSYSAIEECKADILSMYNHLYLLNNGIYNTEYIKKAQATYIAGLYRSIRFGTGAHATSNYIQLNFLKEKKAIFKNSKNKYEINENIFFDAVKELANQILMIQINGEKNKAEEIINKYGKLTEEIKEEVKLFSNIPRDIDTKYKIVK